MKGEIGIDTSTRASNTDLASLKIKVYDLNVDKTITLPADLSKLSNVMENDFIKKTVYNKLNIKFSSIDAEIPSTKELVTKTQYDSDKQSLEKNIDYVDKKIPNTSELIKTTDYNTIITNTENEIPSVTLLVFTAVLNTKATEIENEIPVMTDLATKAFLNTKTTEV